MNKLIIKIWVVFFLVILNAIFFLDLLPKMISEPQTEVVLFGVVLALVMATIDYYAVHALFFRKKKEVKDETTKGDNNG